MWARRAVTVARRTGLRPFNFDLSSERNAMGHLLGQISTESVREHGVMLSAIVIHLNENDAGRAEAHRARI
jgi:hypothetical protein